MYGVGLSDFLRDADRFECTRLRLDREAATYIQPSSCMRARYFARRGSESAPTWGGGFGKCRRSLSLSLSLSPLSDSPRQGTLAVVHRAFVKIATPPTPPTVCFLRFFLVLFAKTEQNKKQEASNSFQKAPTNTRRVG